MVRTGPASSPPSAPEPAGAVCGLFWGAVGDGAGSTRRRSAARALGRLSRSFSRHSRTTASTDEGTCLSSGSSCRMRCMTAGTVVALNAGRPLAAKTMVPAHANMSTASVGGSPADCSGDMYEGVPMSPLVTVAESTRRTMPKSTTRGPSGPSRTLDGLKSRCTTPALWIAARAGSARRPCRPL